MFRCEQDFTKVEIMAENFRNGFEVAVDSYGTMWQSDQEEPGNGGDRVSYVMENGNFGYIDEMTGASWRLNRTNLEDEIPRRHWHQNDPGVVPDLLETGSGFPMGMTIYEGDLLPRRYWDQILLADAAVMPNNDTLTAFGLRTAKIVHCAPVQRSMSAWSLLPEGPSRVPTAQI